MSPTPAYPYYPAPHEPARRPSRRRWLWAPIAFVAAAMLVTTVAAVSIVRSVEAGFDSYIDDPKILTVIAQECERMTETVNGLTVDGSPRHQAEIIRKQNKAAQRMLDAVLALDADLLASDKPTLAWVADWEQLINVRSQFADQVAFGAQPDLKEPKDADGDPILGRMDWASEPECVIPDALLDPYPEDSEEI